MMKNVNLQIEIKIKPEVIWRLKLFMVIMRFAVWVGGFGGVEFDIPERHLTKRTPDGGCTCAKSENYIIQNDGVVVCASCLRPRR